MNEGQPKYVVRRMKNNQALAVVDLLVAAYDFGISDQVPRLIPTREGAYTVPDTGDTRLLMCTYLPGRTPKDSSTYITRETGRLLALLHRASASLADNEAYPRGRDLATSSWFRVMNNSAFGYSLSPPDYSLIRRAIEIVRANENSYRSLPPILLHGDVTLANLADDASRIRLFDYGGVLSAPRLLDVQGALANLTSKAGTLREPLVDAFFEGYTAVWPLKDGEIRLLDIAMAGDLARIIVWLTETANQQNTHVHHEREWRLSLLRSLLTKIDS